MNIEAIELELAKSTYARVDEKLRPFSDEILLMLLDSKSTRVGDTAAGLLMQREKHDEVIEAILNSRFKTTIGRIRASNVLLPFGKSIPKAEAAYLHLLGDKSARVVDNALFGLVFWQNKQNIPAIESAKSNAKPGGKVFAYCEQAIEALRLEKPFLIAPHFADPDNIWQLRPDQIPVEDAE